MYSTRDDDIRTQERASLLHDTSKESVADFRSSVRTARSDRRSRPSTLGMTCSPIVFAHGKERTIGVCNTVPMSAFQRQESMTSELTVGIHGTASSYRTDPPSYVGTPIVQRSNFFEESEGDIDLTSNDSKRFSSVDLLSGSSHPRFQKKRNTLQPRMLRDDGYGSLGSTGVAITFPRMPDNIRIDWGQNAATSVASRAGATSTATGISNAALFSFLLILGTAFASSGNLGVTAAVAPPSCFCYLGICLFQLLTDFKDDNPIRPGAFQLELPFVETLLKEGWSSEAIDSYESDMCRVKSNRRVSSFKDVLINLTANLIGAFLPGVPVLIARWIDAKNISISLILSGALTLLTCLVRLQISRNTAACEANRHSCMTSPLAWFVCGCAVMIAVGFALQPI